MEETSVEEFASEEDAEDSIFGFISETEQSEEITYLSHESNIEVDESKSEVDESKTETEKSEATSYSDSEEKSGKDFKSETEAFEDKFYASEGSEEGFTKSDAPLETPTDIAASEDIKPTSELTTKQGRFSFCVCMDEIKKGTEIQQPEITEGESLKERKEMEAILEAMFIPRRCGVDSPVSRSVSLLDLDSGTISGLLDKYLHLTKIGDPRACSIIGRIMFAMKKFSQAREYLSQCPEWDLEAQYRLGIIYFDGLGIPADPAKALQHMMVLAETSPKNAGIAEALIRSAQYLIACSYYGGLGIKQSDEIAVRWWKIAAQDGKPNGSTEAMSALGYYYSDPWHQDLKAAAFWHEQASKNGNRCSKGCYGVMCKYGIGRKQDNIAALKILKSTVEKYSNVYAAGNLIAFYFERKMYSIAATLALQLLKDWKDWINKKMVDAEKRGRALASFYLARCYHAGLGVDKDITQAKIYYRLAVALHADIIYPLYCDHLLGLT